MKYLFSFSLYIKGIGERKGRKSGRNGDLDDKIVLNLKISRQKVCSLKEKLYFCSRNEERRRIFSLKRKKRLVFGSNKQFKEKAI